MNDDLQTAIAREQQEQSRYRDLVTEKAFLQRRITLQEAKVRAAHAEVIACESALRNTEEVTA